MKRSSILILLALAIVAVGCDNSPQATTEADEKAVVMSAFKSATATRLASKTADGDPEYLLQIAFDPNHPGIRLPEAVNVLPQLDGTPVTAVTDDGTGFDAVAGDGIFSAVVPNGCVGSTDAAGKAEIPLVCDVKIVAPGEQCLGYGTCPERVHRSLLWGLIEYDTDIVFCFCLEKCSVSASGSFGS
jgi:hypothetical protein